MANFCTKCGAELQSDMKFCTKCGASVKNEGEREATRVNLSKSTELKETPRVNLSKTTDKVSESTIIGATEIIDSKENVKQTEMTKINTDRVTKKNSVRTAQNSGNNSRTKLVVAATLVAVLLGAGGGYYMYGKSSPENTKQVTMDPTGKYGNKSANMKLKDDTAIKPNKDAASKNKSEIIEKAKSEISEYGIKGEFKSTSYGNSKDGFISVRNDGQIVVVDRKNHRAGLVKPRMSLEEFQRQIGKKNPPPIILDCIFLNENKGDDAKAGYWEGNNHHMSIYANYSFERDNNLVPGMLTTGEGRNPSHFQEVLYEVRNVDFANLFLTEAIRIQL